MCLRELRFSRTSAWSLTSCISFQLAFVNPTINSGCTNLFAGGVSIDGYSQNACLLTSTIKLLCLGRTGQDCTTNHEVGTGEFCAEIASNAGTALSTLLANNANVNSDCSNLRLGEVSTHLSTCRLESFSY